MAKLKTKVRKMTKGRKALFEKYHCDPELAQKSHEELERNFDRWCKSKWLTDTLGIEFTGNRRKDGDTIIEALLKRYGDTDPEVAQRKYAEMRDGQQRAFEKTKRRVDAMRRLRDEFLDVFGVPLSSYWPNDHTGFDITRFDEYLIESGENESVAQAVERKYGKRALEIVRELIA